MSDSENDGEERALDLVRYMVQTILGNDVDIELDVDTEPGEICIDVHVPSEYRGRIIGRHGRVARSMRNVLAASQLGLHRRATLDIVD